jgi:hypothetical protein
MRVVRLPVLLLVAVLLGTLLPLGAARSAGMQYVTDGKGRFRIGFPAGWRVSVPSGDTPAVQGVDGQSGRPYLNVNVVLERLPQALSPAEYARMAKPLMAATFHEFRVLQEGSARIARRNAYYRYYTWKSNAGSPLYQVQAYFTAGRQGYVITGTTANNPSRVRKDVPVISQIFETFAPGDR